MSNNPDLIPVPFAQGGQKTNIPLERGTSDPVYRASWVAGFPPDTRIPVDVGGEAPDGLDFNGVLNALSQAVVFLQRGNAYQFDLSLAPYPIGALVRSNDNLTTYQNIIASNSNDPNVNMSGWRIYNTVDFIKEATTTVKGVARFATTQEVINRADINAIVRPFDIPQPAGVPDASTTQKGVVQLNNSLTSISTTQALTAAQGKVLQDGKLGRSENAVSATDCSRSIVAGNGLSGGGDLTADRTVTLGTPGTVTASTGNTVSASSHTHNLDVNSLPLLGVGQTWQNVTSSRSSNTTYTNNTGKPIMIAVTKAPRGVAGYIQVSGIDVARFDDNDEDGTSTTIVPNGATYLVANLTNILMWAELR